MSELRTLYPEIEPFDTGRLKVSDVHELYYEQCGNPEGQAVVFLHGGPGAGLVPDYRRFFDPAAYRIVLFDQRGSRKSTPHASLEDNTTRRQHYLASRRRYREATRASWNREVVGVLGGRGAARSTISNDDPRKHTKLRVNQEAEGFYSKDTSGSELTFLTA